MGTDPNLSLSEIHGVLAIDGNNAILDLSEVGEAYADNISLNFDRTTFTTSLTSGLLQGIESRGTGEFRIALSDSPYFADTVTVQSLLSETVNVRLSNVQTRDLVVLGPTIGPSQPSWPIHDITVNGAKPIYAVPSSAQYTATTWTVPEGTIVDDPVWIRDELADRSLATLVASAGGVVNSGGYRWQFEVPGESLQTYALDATDWAATGCESCSTCWPLTSRRPPTMMSTASGNKRRCWATSWTTTNYNDHPLVSLVGGASHGTLTLKTAGTFSYTSEPGFIGDDTFTYRANDGLADSNVATVTIHVLQNHAPEAQNDLLLRRMFRDHAAGAAGQRHRCRRRRAERRDPRPARTASCSKTATAPIALCRNLSRLFGHLHLRRL